MIIHRINIDIINKINERDEQLMLFMIIDRIKSNSSQMTGANTIN